MNFEAQLNSDETILLKVVPKKGLMLHANDLFKIIFGIFWLAIAIAISISLKRLTINSVAFILLGLGFMIYPLYIRYNNTNGIQYLITNQRVVFTRNGVFLKQIELNNLKEASYENWGNDKGYIILGKPEPLFDGRGINLKEDKYVLDNLTNYKEVSTLINTLIQKKQA